MSYKATIHLIEVDPVWPIDKAMNSKTQWGLKNNQTNKQYNLLYVRCIRNDTVFSVYQLMFLIIKILDSDSKLSKS